jgi:hypothetical protein
MLHVTHGLNVFGGQVAQGLNSSFGVEEEIITVLVGDWFVRRDKNSPLIGPMSFRDADRQARYMSVDINDSGLAEVVTFLGERAGDPVTFPSRLFVHGMYARGKKFLGGRTAQFHSDNELITEAPTFGYALFGFRNK